MSNIDFKKKFSELKIKTLPFEDEYFKGLSYEQIAELAKKSIRLTADNRELEDGLENMNAQLEALTQIHNSTVKQYERLENKYDEILHLAKTSADAYEFCMKTLEKENEELKEKLNNVRKLMEKYENESNKKGA